MFFYVPHELISAGKCCETGPTVFRPHPRRLESLTSSQMSLQREHFLLIYLKILSVGPAGVTRDLPRTGALSTELTRRRLINQD